MKHLQTGANDNAAIVAQENAEAVSWSMLGAAVTLGMIVGSLGVIIPAIIVAWIVR